MKVYHWQGIRRVDGKRITTREIACTNNKRDARALTGNFIPLGEIHESFTDVEIDAASARPDTILWRPIDARRPYTWHEVPRDDEADRRSCPHCARPVRVSNDTLAEHTRSQGIGRASRRCEGSLLDVSNRSKEKS